MTPSRLWLLIAPLQAAGARLSKPEDIFGGFVASMLREAALKGRLRCVFTHPANEIAASRSVDEKRKRSNQLRYFVARALGLIPGAADLWFIGAKGGCLIELKAGGNGLSDNQKLYAEWCSDHGVPYHVVRAKDSADIPAAVERVRQILIKEGLYE